MTKKTFFGGIALVGATALVTTGLLAQEYGQPEMSKEQMAMHQAWEKYMTPGEPHERLAQKAGEWTVTGEMFESPDSPPMPFEGKSKLKSIMGGRYLIEKFEGDFQGMPFEGMAMIGFDNLTQTYVSSWIDNMGTGIMRSVGTPSGDGKTIHYTSDHPDFLTGTYKKMTMVEKIVDDDNMVMDFYSTTPDGDQFKGMHLAYTRK